MKAIDMSPAVVAELKLDYEPSFGRPRADVAAEIFIIPQLSHFVK